MFDEEWGTQGVKQRLDVKICFKACRSQKRIKVCHLLRCPNFLRSKNQLTKLANISYIKLLAKKSNIPKSWRLSLKNIEIDFLSNFRFSQLFWSPYSVLNCYPFSMPHSLYTASINWTGFSYQSSGHSLNNFYYVLFVQLNQRANDEHWSWFKPPTNLHDKLLGHFQMA